MSITNLGQRCCRILKILRTRKKWISNSITCLNAYIQEFRNILIILQCKFWSSIKTSDFRKVITNYKHLRFCKDVPFCQLQVAKESSRVNGHHEASQGTWFDRLLVSKKPLMKSQIYFRHLIMLISFRTAFLPLLCSLPYAYWQQHCQ